MLILLQMGSFDKSPGNDLNTKTPMKCFVLACRRVQASMNICFPRLIHILCCLPGIRQVCIKWKRHYTTLQSHRPPSHVLPPLIQSFHAPNLWIYRSARRGFKIRSGFVCCSTPTWVVSFSSCVWGVYENSFKTHVAWGKIKYIFVYSRALSSSFICSAVAKGFRTCVVLVDIADPLTMLNIIGG